MTTPHDSNIPSFKDDTRSIAFTGKLSSRLSIDQRLDYHNKHEFDLKEIGLIKGELFINEQKTEEQNLRSFLPRPSTQKVKE